MKEMNGEFSTKVTDQRIKGTLVQWDDAKGFGWIEAGGKRCFAHIKDFDRRGGRRPVTGDEVEFVKGADPQGRSCGKQIGFLSTKGTRRKGMGIGSWIALGLLLALPGLASLFVPFEPWYLTVWGCVASVFTAGMYFHDKKMAELGGWRIPESVLHFGELAGGWPGAFVAQRMLRHKISKGSYKVVFWLVVVAHQVVALDVFLDGTPRRWIAGWMQGK